MKAAPKKKPPTLSRNEKLYLRLARQLEEHQEPWSDQSIVHLAGWKSIDDAWTVRDLLLRKGYLEDGARAVMVECPVITNAGLAAIGVT